MPFSGINKNEYISDDGRFCRPSLIYESFINNTNDWKKI